MDEEIEYSLYDGADGKRYTVMVTQARAKVLKYDEKAAYRECEKAKKTKRRAEQQPRPIVAGTDDLRSPPAKKGQPKQERPQRTLVDNVVEPIVQDDLEEEFVLLVDNVVEPIVQDDLEEVLALPIEEDVPKPLKSITNWVEDDRAVHMLLNLCGPQMCSAPNSRAKPVVKWTEISAKLAENGYKFTAEKCRIKKNSLMQYYPKLAKGNRFVGKVKYPFYDALTHIHNGVWPEGFQSGSSTTDDDRATAGNPSEGIFNSTFLLSSSTQHKPQPSSSGRSLFKETDGDQSLSPIRESIPPVITNAVPSSEWGQPHEDCNADEEDTEEEKTQDRAIMEEYFEAKQEWASKLYKETLFYNDVAIGVSKWGYSLSGAYCKKRVAALMKRFKDEYDHAGKTGNPPSTWYLFEFMLKGLGEDDPALSPVKTVSLGAKAKVQSKGNDLNTSVEATRCVKGRPPTENRQKKVMKLVGERPLTTKQNERERALDLQERRLANDESFTNEFRMFRLDMNVRAEKLEAALLARNANASNNSNTSN